MPANCKAFRLPVPISLLCGVLTTLLPTGVYANCDNASPASGEVTTCVADPLAVTQPIAAQTDSSQTNVNIAAGATLNITGDNAILVYNDSRIENLGTITIDTDTFDAISSRGNGNIQINGGLISTSGVESEGLYSQGDNNQLFNDVTGVINTTGDDASGMLNRSLHDASNNILRNDGAITTSGSGSVGMDVRSGGNILTNNGTITTSGDTAYGIEGNGTNNTLINNGSILTQGVGANGLNLVGGATSGTVTNNGTVTTRGDNANGIYASNAGTFTNTANGTISTGFAYGIYVTAGGTIINAGTITAGKSALTNESVPLTVINSGHLSSRSFAGIWFYQTPGDVLNNSGDISSDSGIAVQYSAGNDQFIWHDSGVVQGSVLMDAGNDSAVLRNLNTSLLASASIDGGPGNDSLLLDNTQADNPQRFTDFETVSLTNNSALTLNTPLTLGDVQTATGSLLIDRSSQLLAGEQPNAQILPFTVGSQVTVTNAGVIDLTHGGNSTADRLTINGNYVGDNGIIRLQSVLGDDSSPADRVTISGGEARGNTQLQVINLSGPGAATLANGILLVDTTNGGTTTANAFTLSGGSLSAGAYEYRLFRGGVTAGTENDWFLRNSLIITPPVNPGTPTGPGTPSAPGTPTDPGTPSAPGTPTGPGTPSAPGTPTGPGTPSQPGTPVTPATPTIVPLWRAEVPLYTAVTPLALNMGMTQIATFHERQGDQRFLTHDSNGSWGRIIGTHTHQNWGGDVSPSFDGSVSGVQVGQDFYADSQSRAGIFFGYTRTQGDVRGFTQGIDANKAGSIWLNGYSLGGYWTHLWGNQAYLDVVLMNTWLQGSQSSVRDINADTKGTLRSASLEMGVPFSVSQRWSLEPEAQVIAQSLSLDDSHDRISSIAYDDVTSYTGRIGLRLQGDYSGLQPWISVNYWQGQNQTVQMRLARDEVNTPQGGRSLQTGAGISAQLNKSVNIYLAASEISNLDSERRKDYAGDLGVRINW